MPPAGRVILSGALDALSLADVLSFLDQIRASGVLRSFGEHSLREVVIVEGQIRGVRSNAAGESLLDAATQLGFLTPEQQSEISRSGSARALDPGLLTREKVWASLQEQAVGVLMSLAGEVSGRFELWSPVPDGAATLPGLAISHLLLEALRRCDELAQLRWRVPSRHARVELLDAGAAGPASKRSRELLEHLAPGPLCVREIMETLRMSELDAARAIGELCATGAVRVTAAARAAEPEQILEIANGALAEIFAAARAAGAGEDLLAAALDWEAAYRGQVVVPRGSLGSGAALAPVPLLECVERAAAASADAPLQVLLDVVVKSVLFLLFVSSELLEPEAYKRLHARVQVEIERACSLAE